MTTFSHSTFVRVLSLSLLIAVPGCASAPPRPGAPPHPQREVGAPPGSGVATAAGPISKLRSVEGITGIGCRTAW
jgi:hypothetical protein